MDKRAIKRANGEMLVHAIRYNDMVTFRKILQRIAVLDDVDIIEIHGRPLYFAILHHQFDMARELVQHGANVNFVPTSRTSNHLMCYAASEQAITFLLQNGSRIPKGVSQDTQNVAKAYVCRSWAPENHGTWPTLFRQQVVAILCSVARTRRPMSPFVLGYLLQFVVTAHFVWE